MDKKYLILIGIVAGLTIVGLIVFWGFFGPGTAPAPITTENGGFPEAGKSPLVIPQTGLTPPPPTISAGQQKALNQLSEKAVAGATYTEKILEDKTKIGIVRYIEKATGHIYDVDYLKGITSAVRISNTTIPNIFEIKWSPNGNQAILRYTEENETGVENSIRNFAIPSVTATSTRGIFLLSSISGIASSPKENRIFYFAPWEDSYIGITANFEDKKQKQIFTTPFKDFIVSWPSEKIISLLSRPSYDTEGYLYKLDPVSGSFERILAGIKGLTSLWSPDGEFIIYGEGGFQTIKTNIYDIKNKRTAAFNATTFPEKCAWSSLKKGVLYCAIPLNIPPAAYPDDWYQGAVSFQDRVWKIDAVNGTTEIISSEAGDNVQLDLINPFLDKNENHLFFQNKTDGSLWSLQIF